MKEAYQLKLKTIKTILKVREKQALWAEENESKQECLKVGLFHRIRSFQHTKNPKTKQNKHKSPNFKIQRKTLFISV